MAARAAAVANEPIHSATFPSREKASRDERKENEDRPDPVDADLGVSRRAGADAGDLLTLADPVEPAAARPIRDDRRRLTIIEANGPRNPHRPPVPAGGETPTIRVPRAFARGRRRPPE
jgi:hypothetical protein